MIGDEKIIDLFFERSEKAIWELDLKYGKIFRKLSQNVVNGPQDVEECVNDAYLGVWNAIPPTRPNSLPAYVCKIVRNVSLKLYWKKEADKRSCAHTVTMEELEECISGPKTVETEMEAREIVSVIEGFLDTLTAENRIIFMRRYWFCDSCRDIAELVNLTEKNISVRLTRIRRKLKDYLLEKGVSI